MVDQVVLVGNVGSMRELTPCSPRGRNHQEGGSAARQLIGFSLAVDTPNGAPRWYDCVAFDQNAQSVHDNVQSGNQVVVIGHVQCRQYTNAKGETVPGLHVVVDSIHFKTMDLVVVRGTLGHNPEVRNANGRPVCNVRIAVDRQGDARDWYRVVLFDKNAQTVAKYMKAGRTMTVTGRMHVRKYRKADGAEETSVELIGSHVVFDPKRSVVRTGDPFVELNACGRAAASVGRGSTTADAPKPQPESEPQEAVAEQTPASPAPAEDPVKRWEFPF